MDLPLAKKISVSQIEILEIFYNNEFNPKLQKIEFEIARKFAFIKGSQASPQSESFAVTTSFFKAPTFDRNLLLLIFKYLKDFAEERKEDKTEKQIQYMPHF